MNKDHKPYLLAEVKKIFRKTIHVICDGKTAAILPYRELAWTEEERKEIYNKLREGYPLEVIAKPRLEINEPEVIVSHKRYFYDFWNAEINIDRNKALMIQVDVVTPKRAYGKVYWEAQINGEPKTIELNGYFYFKELDTFIKANFPEKKWRKHAHILVGDCLMGLVRQVDRDREELELNITEYLKKIQSKPQSVFPFLEDSGHQEAQDMAEITPRVVPYEPLTAAEEISRIAVIDNDLSFLKALVDTLNSLGYYPQGFASAEEFKSKCNLQALNFDVAFIDANLKTDDDHEGISLAQEIYQDNPYIKIVIITGEPTINQRKVDGGPDLTIYDYVTKPFSYEIIQDCLQRLATSQPFPLADLLQPSPPSPARPANHQTETPIPEGTEQGKEVLQQLCAYHLGSTAVIFRMHTNTLDCKLILQESPMQPADRFLAMLKFSPVKDCIIQEEQIYASDVQAPGSPQQRKHKWLLCYWGDYPAYQSCLGIKLNYRRQGAGYALFWFHPEKHVFNRASKHFARMAARYLDATYALRGLREELTAERKLSLGGKTMQMVGHELATPMSTISLSINNYLKELKKTTGSPGYPPEFPPEVLVNINRAARIARELQFYLKGKRPEEFDFKEAIRKSYKSLEELYPDLEIIPKPWPKQKFILMGNPSALEQAVFNILLNSAQQMDLIHRPQGVIRISLQEEPQGWAKLLVQDSGPGIHPQDFERIFQEGFSTKIKGSGLGLGISRRLLEDIGGSLKISYSILFVSSCFEIKIPLVRVQS